MSAESSSIIVLPLLLPLPAVAPPSLPPLVRPAAHHASLSRAPDMDAANPKFIAFYHPAHSCFSAVHSVNSRDDIHARMFMLPAFDNGGLHYGTALAACSIVACNKPGYFSTDTPLGPEPSRRTWDAVLTPGTRYYYHLGNCPFNHWIDPLLTRHLQLTSMSLLTTRHVHPSATGYSPPTSSHPNGSPRSNYQANPTQSLHPPKCPSASTNATAAAA